LENVDTQNLQYSAQTFVDPMNLIETGHHEVNAQGDPDLGSHGVVACSEERFYAEVLFDPFEEQLDLPAAFVDGGDGNGRMSEMIRKEAESFPRLRIDITDSAQRHGVVAFSLPCAQPDSLVATQSCRFVDSPGLQNVELGVALGANHEVAVCDLDPKKTTEVEVASVEHIDASSLDGHLVHEVDVVHRTFGNPHKHRDGSGKIDLRVQFDRCFGPSKMCPRKHRQTQVDSGGVDGVNHLVEVEAVGVSGAQVPGFADQNLSECFVNAPIPMLVRIGEVRSCDVATYAHRIEMCATPQAGFDVPQTFPKGNLREGHGEELVAVSHAFAGSWHRVQPHAALELFAVQQIDDLGEDQASGIHPLLRMDQGRNGQPVQMRDT